MYSEAADAALRIVCLSHQGLAPATLPPDPTFLPALSADAEISALKTRLDPARTKANEARQKLNDLEQEQRKLQAKLDGSYGEGDAFVALVDRCFDAKVRCV